MLGRLIACRYSGLELQTVSQMKLYLLFRSIFNEKKKSLNYRSGIYRCKIHLSGTVDIVKYVIV